MLSAITHSAMTLLEIVGVLAALSAALLAGTRRPEPRPVPVRVRRRR